MNTMALERSPTLSDQAMERLVEGIVRGDLKPGDRIQEATLARSLGISRGPLREAIRRLEGRKLLTRVPRVGVSVADPSVADVLEIYTIREVLEGLAARIAAEMITDQELDQLEATLESHGAQSDVRQGEAYYQVAGYYDFHYQVIMASRNQRLIEMLLGELYHVLRIFRYRASAKPGRAQDAFCEHAEITAALRARDGERAEALMRKHILRARAGLKDALERRDD